MIKYQAALPALSRQFFTFLLSCLLAGAGFSTVLLRPFNAVAAGVDAGGLAAAADMGGCSDSGVLAAFAGAKRQELGKCPLKHTDVRATISGYVARVTVKQQFHNPYKEKIEAVYTFPLPADAAVDEMTMKVGNRLIKGSIKKKDEARKVYETARSRGQIASLLDQERPNIFTQSVANIEAGQNIDIEINYVNLLKYEDGAFSFVFPTLVGPRFIPGNRIEGKSGHGLAQDSDLVPDASRITPPYAAENERAGHDISISLDIDAAVPIKSISSRLHDVEIVRPSQSKAQVKLKAHDKIPNKDFILKYSLAQDAVQSGYLTHKQGKEGFFSLMLVPPKSVSAESVQPKEMVFVIDCSGSQSGKPIEKAKETMDYILRNMNPNDTFQMISFNSGTEVYPQTPQQASKSMKDGALSFLAKLQAQGGTWMAPAVEKACSLPNPEHRLRIITFMTDGYVGNDMEILSMIRKYRGNSRWFSFGTGNSVNRFLIDGIAKEGGGEAEYVLLNSSADQVGKKFYERIKSPVLTDLKLEFEGVEVKEVYPKELSELWAQRPLYFSGRYSKGGSGKAILTGFAGGKPYKQVLDLKLPEENSDNQVLSSVWAREKVERLMRQDWGGLLKQQFSSELKEEIESTGLKYHIMTQFTSFVAVEENSKTGAGKAKTVLVPVENPDGVSLESSRPSALPMPRRASFRSGRGGGGGGSGGGYGLGWSSGPVASSYLSNGSRSMSGQLGTQMLPQSSHSSMGKYIHQEGDNLYHPGDYKSELRANLAARGNQSSKTYNNAKLMQIINHRPARSEKSGDKGKSPQAKDESDLNNSKIERSLLAYIEKASASNSTAILEIRIELTDKAGLHLFEKLKKLGFVLSLSKDKILLGRIEQGKIKDLALLPEIRQISRPQT